MNRAKELLSRINSPDVVGVLRCDNENGRFIEYVRRETRAPVAFRFEYPDGTVEVVRPKKHPSRL